MEVAMPAGHEHEIEFTVDGEELETTARELTANQILEMAGIDPANHYLIKVDGREQDPIKDGATIVKLHEHEKFISAKTGPTPVS